MLFNIRSMETKSASREILVFLLFLLFQKTEGKCGKFVELMEIALRVAQILGLGRRGNQNKYMESKC